MRVFRVCTSYVVRFLSVFVVYLAIVMAGITLFLIVAPVFGYLPYGDRPGAEWTGRFPVLEWSSFKSNAREMLGYGWAFTRLFVRAAALCAVILVFVDRVCRRRSLVRLFAATIGGLIAGLWMLMIGWYIAAGPALFFLSACLGALAGIVAIDCPRSINSHCG